MKPKRLDDYCWEIPKEGGMRVPGRVYGDEALIRQAQEDGSLVQVSNVAHLPGVVGYSLAMPDIHAGYGFPIGGVAATDPEEGVVSPGGVGYDINCGVRLIGTGLKLQDVQGEVRRMVGHLYSRVPAGVGSSGAIRKLSEKELKAICMRGSRWAVEKGFGSSEDLRRTEELGCLPGADPSHVSPRAFKRGLGQLGTLGSGNHFLEMGVVEELYDLEAARAFGLEAGQVTLLIHSGSRGFGHQVCDDFLKQMLQSVHRHGIRLPDRQLACAPVQSREGRKYLAAMACAANYAWANRQVIMSLALDGLEEALGMDASRLRGRMVFDVSHNIAKMERHIWQGREIEVCVHRKGATRALPAGHALVPDVYRQVGQPVLIPGDMGRASFVCVGTAGAMEATFGSTCHGAGRVMSRSHAKRAAKGRSISGEMASMGVEVLATGRTTLAEEMPEAYKDVEAVVNVMHGAGISRKVAKLRPLGVVKG